ncbi:MAG: RdgB/HAM1 family non-canonical purine NTP pyrophosphatase [Candidatus Gastranaerophilales bacterium]|nr:RdgB/HAM1 family non-canonical purine NTP pyrophosphatase [Candidatus Gastranaerophilales bacterium]
MKSIVFATSNEHKIYEVQSKFDCDNVDIKIIPVTQPFEPEENGTNFLENAYIKAFEAAKIMGVPAFADDSGLCVDALGGLPGIHSARYAPTRDEKITKLLNALKDFPQEQERKAHFSCAISLVTPEGEELFSTESQCNGYIIKELHGTNGFGYDPVFYVKEYNKTFAELDIDKKNRISHRALALNNFIKFIKNNKS